MPGPIALITSHGGHLDLLAALRPALAGRDRVWLTPPSEQAAALREEGERVEPITNPLRSPSLVARNVREALRFLRRVRPSGIVSAGAGVAVAPCLVGRATGTPLVFIETMARTVNGSATGRLLSRLADHVLVQWPSLQAVYPRAEVCRPALLEDIREGPPPPGSGTFVAAGSHGAPFDRLLELVDRAAADGVLPDPVVVQGSGRDYRPRHLSPAAHLPAAVMRDAIATAEVVIAHGGSGVLALALRSGRVPLVLPRRAAHGEHVDDHQVAMTARLAEHGLAVSLDDHDLAGGIALARGGVPAGATRAFPGPPLADRLHAILADLA